jgi:hypothetical protein
MMEAAARVGATRKRGLRGLDRQATLKRSNLGL